MILPLPLLIGEVIVFSSRGRLLSQYKEVVRDEICESGLSYRDLAVDQHWFEVFLGSPPHDWAYLSTDERLAVLVDFLGPEQ